MTPRSALSSFFPLRFEPAALVPATALTAGLLALETALHVEHPAAAVPAAFEELRALGGARGWDSLYGAASSVYLAPLLVPALRLTPGLIRRLFMGFACLLAVGALVAVLSAGWKLELVPCLLVASATFVLAILARLGLLAPAAFALALTLAAALATILTRRHDLFDVALGVAAGYATYRLAFSKELWFLERPDPWAAIDQKLRDLWNLFVRNEGVNWERTYAAGQWDFLDAPSQRPRHYVIAGLLADRFPAGARVLDVGCGTGALFGLLRGRVASYTGVDLSEAAVRRCAAKFSGDPAARFVTAAFEGFSSDERFDVVVLNEVLYYFPRAQAAAIMRRAARLAAPSGIVVVSMNRNFKARLVWRALDGLWRPEQSVRATNLETGSYWTVNMYRTADIGGPDEDA